MLLLLVPSVIAPRKLLLLMFNSTTYVLCFVLQLFYANRYGGIVARPHRRCWCWVLITTKAKFQSGL